MNKCLAYLNKFNLICAEQSGFGRNHSCHTALSKITSSLLRETDNGNITGFVYVDFKKAFDLVDYDILIRKLECYNFDEFLLRWFKCYLTQRTQVVQLNSNFSQQGVLRGVSRKALYLGLYLSSYLWMISTYTLVPIQQFLQIISRLKNQVNLSKKLKENARYQSAKQPSLVLRTKW